MTTGQPTRNDKPISITFKDWKDVNEWAKMHPLLQKVFADCVKIARDCDFEDLVITQIFRDDGGVHGTSPIRGIDCVPSDRNVEDMHALREKLNNRWKYGRGQFEVVVPIRHGSAPHIHIQVCDLTARRQVESD